MILAMNATEAVKAREEKKFADKVVETLKDRVAQLEQELETEKEKTGVARQIMEELN